MEEEGVVLNRNENIGDHRVLERVRVCKIRGVE